MMKNYDDFGCVITCAVLMICLLIAGIVAGVLINRADNSCCINAGYDGYMRGGSGGYCYHIIDGTRVLTPLSVIPKPEK